MRSLRLVDDDGDVLYEWNATDVRNFIVNYNTYDWSSINDVARVFKTWLEGDSA